jgi:hypothetical protein
MFESTRSVPRLFLGIEITHDKLNHSITLSQGQYIRRILELFNMRDARTVSIPLDPSLVAQATTDNDEFEHPSLYRAAIGSLMYAALGTRPDIAFAVHSLSQFASNPSKCHWQAVGRIFRYLQGTKDYGIKYDNLGGKATITVIGYSDADWGSNAIDRRSISGYAFFLGGGTIAWSSKKQPTVSLSSMEAEYMASSHAVKEAIWLRSFLNGIGFQQNEASELFLDNQSAIALAYNPEFHARSKHIDIRHHFIREAVENGTVELIWCPTDEMTADIFTKALARPKFWRFREDLGMCSV